MVIGGFYYEEKMPSIVFDTGDDPCICLSGRDKKTGTAGGFSGDGDGRGDGKRTGSRVGACQRAGAGNRDGREKAGGDGGVERSCRGSRLPYCVRRGGAAGSG